MKQNKKPSPLGIDAMFRCVPKSTRKMRQKFKKQRCNRGYADCDLWNMDWYLMELIPSMLEDLAKRHNGHPYDMTDEEYTKWLLDTADLFRQAYAILDGEISEENSKRYEWIISEAFDSLKEHFSCLWD